MGPYINRELSWLAFNRRILAEAQRENNLPLDRLRFLSITASNLDEFIMVRVAHIYQKSRKKQKPDLSGYTPKNLFGELGEQIGCFRKLQSTALAEIFSVLEKHQFSLLSLAQLTARHHSFLDILFRQEILPALTPMAVDYGRPFPFFKGKGLYVGARLLEGGKDCFGFVEVPSTLPRFIALPAKEGEAFIPVEDVVLYHMQLLFSLPIQGKGIFRLLRCADISPAYEGEDFIGEMQETVNRRKHAFPIAIEYLQDIDPSLLQYIASHIPTKAWISLPCSDIPALAGLGKLSRRTGWDNIRLPEAEPAPSPRFQNRDDLFAVIREQDVLLHHPYQSFSHVVNFLYQASRDPGVVSIKQSLYRVDSGSGVIAALQAAAKAGKQVAVFVELQARFDEENNMQWVQALEDAGCHVVYGVEELKTHCKMLLVVRREPDGLRRYLHFSTGNYSENTARHYTDIGFFTSSQDFAEDASQLFNRLTGYLDRGNYRKLVVSPEHLRPFLLERIERERRNCLQGKSSGISIKVNALTDPPLIEALYEASRGGVPVRLLVRGICALVPGVPGTSDNIQVRSIVGRFLEHSRIFYFVNSGREEVYLSSADGMPRNMDRRIEVVFPVEQQDLKQQLIDAVNLMWRDTVNGWQLQPDGTYQHIKDGHFPVCAQEQLLENGAKQCQ